MVGKSRIAVSRSALEGNLAAIRRVTRAEMGGDSAAGAAAVLAVIKANGYGHGAAVCAPVLARAGAEWLGVTDAAEGTEVRRAHGDAGIAEQPEILVMCGLEREDVPLVVEQRLTPVVWFAEQVAWLAEASGRTGWQVPIHVEVDTGMARQGVRPGEDLARLLELVKAQPRVEIDGVFTHFASAEVAGSQLTLTQRKRFHGALEQVERAGVRPRWMHASNTSAVDEGGSMQWMAAEAERLGARLLVRSGLALYGYALPVEGGSAHLAPELKQAGTWTTRVIAVREVAAGETVGYNATFTATRPLRLALLPVGYADGLRRELSSTTTEAGGWVRVRGERAGIVGRISMNLTTVDVTAIAGVSVGDEVTLLGEGVSAEEQARLAGTIAYEILCGMRGECVLVD